MRQIEFEHNCPYCNAHFDGVECDESCDESKPKAGELSMCNQCGELGMFTEDGQLRKRTPEEVAKMTPEQTNALRMAQLVLKLKQAISPTEESAGARIERIANEVIQDVVRNAHQAKKLEHDLMCPACGTDLNHCATVGNKNKPLTHGTIGSCFDCGALLRFNVAEDGKVGLEKMTQEEEEKLPDVVQHFLAAVNKAKTKLGKPSRPPSTLH